jgi:CDP-diacylglycerol--serine O-phosphatidyltransferase
MSKMKALIPNLLTAGNLVGGVLAIIFSLTGRLEWAPYCIFISAFLDFFDGFAARLLKVQSEMGKQLDSLADMVTFGVAPGVMVFMLLKIQLSLPFSLPRLGFNAWSEKIMEIDLPVLDRIMSQELDFYIPAEVNMPLEYNLFTWVPLIALIIPVFSMFRLAKFNLDTRQSNSFIGVPTPANTLFFASIPLILIQFSSATTSFDQWIFQLFLNPWFLIVSCIGMSILLVAELPLFALKFKSFGFKGNEIRYIFLTLAVILLATLWWLAIPLIIILYILLSLIQNLRLKTAAAKTSK